MKAMLDWLYFILSQQHIGLNSTLDRMTELNENLPDD